MNKVHIGNTVNKMKSFSEHFDLFSYTYLGGSKGYETTRISL